MVYVEKLISSLKRNKVNFFTGVPDSVLKTLGTYIDSSKNHIISANEGSAISIATGYHLSTKKIPCVYMQNSGLGNAINPLLSITHKEVYSIPMVLVIGWRGAPKLKDEPQHLVTGRITRQLLNLLNIKYCVFEKDSDLKKLEKLIKYSKNNKSPIACLVKNKTLISKYKKNKIDIKNNFTTKAEAIRVLLENVKKNTKIISTTGYTSRELDHIRRKENFNNATDFYMIGGMGHTSAVSLGTSFFNEKNDLICLDGDGSILMHMGTLASIGYYGKKNFKHILLNNNMHESVGGQKTNAKNINFSNLSKSLGYKSYDVIKNQKDLRKKIKYFLKKKGPSFLEIKLKKGVIKDLGRPKNFIAIKKKFMK